MMFLSVPLNHKGMESTLCVDARQTDRQTDRWMGRETSYTYEANLSEAIQMVHKLLLVSLGFEMYVLFQGGSQKFDPMSLQPDKVTLELEIGPSVLLLFGALLRKLMHLKVSV
jgi:hypothetical protein